MIPMAYLIRAGIFAAAIFVFLEWRRLNQQHRAARIAATILAVAALTLLGPHMREKRSEPRSPVATATLWTPGEQPPAHNQPRHHFALPGSIGQPADATTIPDVPYLRRQYPEIENLHIVGDGLEPFELDALRGLRVTFHPGASTPSQPRISFLHAPRQVRLGENLELQGRIEGLNETGPVVLRLESPDGTTTETTIIGRGGEQTHFAI
jgi:hypothetical protein